MYVRQNFYMYSRHTLRDSVVYMYQQVKWLGAYQCQVLVSCCEVKGKPMSVNVHTRSCDVHVYVSCDSLGHSPLTPHNMYYVVTCLHANNTLMYSILHHEELIPRNHITCLALLGHVTHLATPTNHTPIILSNGCMHNAENTQNQWQTLFECDLRLLVDLCTLLSK